MSEYSLKCVLLGDSSVGKTSLVLRYVTNTFSIDPDSTVGASYMSKTIKVNSDLVKLNIWDTAGQERYRSLIRLYYKDVHMALLVYDITQHSSFIQLKRWYEELLAQCQASSLIVVIVANKEDLVAEEEVDPFEGKAYADSIGASFYKTSCKTDSGVSMLFTGITQSFLRKVKNGQIDKEHVLITNKLGKTCDYAVKRKCSC